MLAEDKRAQLTTTHPVTSKLKNTAENQEQLK